jgi:hypothetical protein
VHVSSRSAALSDCKLDLQDDRFLALGQDKAAGHSVLASPTSTGYTVFPGVDTPTSYNFAPINRTCSSNRTAPNVTDVNSCSNYSTGLGICCLDAGPYTVSELEAGRPFGKAVSTQWASARASSEQPNVSSLLLLHIQANDLVMA